MYQNRVPNLTANVSAEHSKPELDRPLRGEQPDRYRAAEPGNRLFLVDEPITLTPAQVAVVAMWSVEGAEMAPVAFYGSAPSFVDSWVEGDVLVTQGDAYIQISRFGDLKDAVPDMAAAATGAGGLDSPDDT